MTVVCDDTAVGYFSNMTLVCDDTSEGDFTDVTLVCYDTSGGDFTDVTLVCDDAAGGYLTDVTLVSLTHFPWLKIYSEIIYTAKLATLIANPSQCNYTPRQNQLI